jgi:hypothetical protein
MKTRPIYRIAVLFLLPAFLLLQGCPTQSTLAALTSTLGNAAASVATLEGNTAAAAQLTTDTAAAVTAIQNWKSGTPATEAIEALNIVEADLNLIPGTSQYAPLITLAISTVESIIALLPQPTTATTLHTVRGTTAAPAKNANDFKKKWNSIIAVNPQLSAATIK